MGVQRSSSAHPLTHSGFYKSSLILFLNKADLLREKLKSETQQVVTSFPDFDGAPFNFNDAIEFFKFKFRSVNRNPNREVYVQ